MISLKKLLESIPKPIRNKYVVTLLIFILWIIFIDNYNIISQYKTYKQIKDLKETKKFYKKEIKKDSTQLYNLRNNISEQEKFAREKFLMKKKNEEIFIIKQTNEK